jgi:hypothetical protein
MSVREQPCEFHMQQTNVVVTEIESRADFLSGHSLVPQKPDVVGTERKAIGALEEVAQPKQLTKDEKRKVIKTRLQDLKKARAGLQPLNEPSENDKNAMKQAFRTAPKNKKAREQFSKTLTPDQYLAYLANIKEQTLPRPYRTPKPHKNQSKACTVMDVETQTMRPAFVMPVLRPMPNKAK